MYYCTVIFPHYKWCSAILSAAQCGLRCPRRKKHIILHSTVFSSSDPPYFWPHFSWMLILKYRTILWHQLRIWELEFIFSPLDFLWSILQTLESKSRDQIPPIIRLLWGMIVQTWRKCHDKEGRRAPQGHQSSHLKATTNSLLLSKKETKLPLLKEASWWCQTLVY